MINNQNREERMKKSLREYIPANALRFYIKDDAKPKNRILSGILQALLMQMHMRKTIIKKWDIGREFCANERLNFYRYIDEIASLESCNLKVPVLQGVFNGFRGCLF